jgi:hypothetical protein
VATAAEDRLNIRGNPRTRRLRQPAIAEAIAILSDQSNREDRKKKEGFSFFKNAGLPVRVGLGKSPSWQSPVRHLAPPSGFGATSFTA